VYSFLSSKHNKAPLELMDDLRLGVKPKEMAVENN
jgi:hypothetical protein